MAPDEKFDVGKMLQWGKSSLKSAGIGDFDISAEVLLRVILGISRSELLTDTARELNTEQVTTYREHIEKRKRRVPLQYVTGITEFYNIIIKCDGRALIPRPETEILVETVINKMSDSESPKILDIGTGSGNIACALARNIEDSKVIGIDISEQALDLAAANAFLNDVHDRAKFISGDIADNDFGRSLGSFDCVVSNPPYISEDDKGRLQAEVREYEPEIALYSPGDPLRFYRIIIAAADSLLNSAGLLAFEIGQGQSSAIKELIIAANLIEIEIIPDLAGIDRVILGRKS